MNGIDVAASRHKNGLKTGARNAKHGVEDDLEVGVADSLQVDMIKDRVNVQFIDVCTSITPSRRASVRCMRLISPVLMELARH